MIGFLSGQPVISGSQVIIMVNGVGYQVAVAANTLSFLSSLDHAELFIHTHVKEDALELFGFPDQESKRIFELLLSVSGVGPRTALHISNHPTQSIITAVQQAQTSFFTAVPRVGKKLAQKIIIDLRSKLGELKALELTPTTGISAEVTEALMGLGFGEQQIQQALEQLDIANLSVEEALKITLQRLN